MIHKKGYRILFQQKKYMQMTSANIINRLGDSIDMIAFSWLVFELTGSASWSAVILGVNMLPTIFVQPFAGALVERLNKKKVMVLCDIARGLLTLMIGTCYINNVLNPWLLLVITFLNNAFEAFRSPASMAFLPHILDKEHYEFGTSFSQTISRVCELIGVALSGVIISLLGLGGAIFIDMISFFLSALIIAKIAVYEQIVKKVELKIHVYITQLKDGFQYVKTSSLLLFLCISAALSNLLIVPFSSFQAAFISGTLQQNADLLSFISIAMSAGMGIGAFLYPFLHLKISNRVLFIGGFALYGSFYTSLFLISFLHETILIYSTFLGASFIFGFGISMLSVILNVRFVQIVDRDHLARAGSIFNAFATSAMPITSFILSVLCVNLSVVQIFFYFAMFTFIIFTAMIFVKVSKEL